MLSGGYSKMRTSHQGARNTCWRHFIAKKDLGKMWNFIWLYTDSSFKTNNSKWLDSSCDSTLTRHDQIVTWLLKIFRWLWLKRLVTLTRQNDSGTLLYFNPRKYQNVARFQSKSKCMFVCGHFWACEGQDRTVARNFSTGGLCSFVGWHCVCAGGGVDILKMGKTPLIYMFHVSIWGSLELCFWG